MTSAGAQHAHDRGVAAIQPVDLLQERHSIRQEVFSSSRKLLVICVAVLLVSSSAIVPMQIGAAAKRHATTRLSNQLVIAAACREKAQSQAAQVAANEELLAKLGEEAAKTRLWRNLLAELGDRVDSRTWLTGLTAKLESAQATVEIKGSAESLKSATRFARTLKSSPFFDQAKLVSTQSTGGVAGQGVTHFECEATLSEEALKAAKQKAPLNFGSERVETDDQD